MEEEALERRLKQEHIIEWLVNAVKTSVTPSQEKQMMTQCMADLKRMATSA